ncbi:hypothetical protein ECG_09674 [Echinococcus granulosus]|nr:hypothetical protein ECG_09674 [Echinococcus granulosus]
MALPVLAGQGAVARLNGQLGPATFWDYFVWHSPNDKTFVLRWEPEDLQKVGVDEIEMTVTPSSGTGQPLHEKVNIATKLIRFTNILLSSGFEISMQALRNETRVIRHIVRLKTYKTGDKESAISTSRSAFTSAIY